MSTDREKALQAMRDYVTPAGMYYDRDGKPMSLWEWAHKFEDNFEYRRIAQDEIGFYRVSTVWLGINMAFMPDHPPLIFETMVFLSGTPEDWGMCRYSTEAEAIAGHEALCAEIRVGEQDTKDRHPSNKSRKQ